MFVDSHWHTGHFFRYLFFRFSFGYPLPNLTNPFSTRCMLGFSARVKVKKVKPSKRNEKDFKPRTEEEVKAEQRSSCLEYISFSHSSLCWICVFIHCKLIQNQWCMRIYIQPNMVLIFAPKKNGQFFQATFSHVLACLPLPGGCGQVERVCPRPRQGLLCWHRATGRGKGTSTCCSKRIIIYKAIHPIPPVFAFSKTRTYKKYINTFECLNVQMLDF